MSLSPNFGERRGDYRPSLIVLHYTAMATAEAAVERLCDPAAEVSAHYLICAQGETIPLVDEEKRAWHAGPGFWAGAEDINSRSIGIELDNNGFQPFPEPQMRALEVLMRGIMVRWAIPPEGVIAHSDFAPSRKIDPGRRFDWLRLAQQGLAVWPGVTAAEAADLAGRPGSAFAFRGHLQRFGYPDVPDQMLLDVFRLRFRPWAQGGLDALDVALAADLAARYPTGLSGD